MTDSEEVRHGGVLIVDFGAQYCQLIARRVREMDVYSRITTPAKAMRDFAMQKPEAVILSGGPRSVYDADAPQLDVAITKQGVPVLGICYGLQWLVHVLGGQVEPDRGRHEYGRTELRVEEPSSVLEGVRDGSVVWMSHGDRVTRLPAGFQVLASSEPCPVAALARAQDRIVGFQFHPEVAHTEQGMLMLRNFVRGVANCAPDWNAGNIIDDKVAAIARTVGPSGEVVMGLSGGVDSSVAAVLIHKAIGDRLHCVFVDNGLLRQGEREGVQQLFRDEHHMDVITVDAARTFLSALAGVDEPERKRKIIGKVFVDVFRAQAQRLTAVRFLGQGTLYPDVIESVSAHGGATATIKSHHNVGGLPDDLDLDLVEPLRDLFKDEVRTIGRELGLPPSLVDRQPFPGPGLAVRCLGEVTGERLAMLREADAIVRAELEAKNLHRELWQYFAVFLPVRSVGVMGDQRTYENAIALRLVSSRDGMTADWECPPLEVLRRISNRITNEVRGINRVVLDVTSKPPGTIEWE
ncbi:MAG: glutamine-hydrolyzing GMP synthase [Planctomycetota bacterium]